MKELIYGAGLLIVAKLILDTQEAPEEHYIIMNQDIYYTNIGETIRTDTTLTFPAGYPSDRKYTYYMITPSGTTLFYGYKTSEMFVDGFNVTVNEFGKYNFYMKAVDTGEQYDMITFDILQI